jgi:hypothetical protein
MHKFLKLIFKSLVFGEIILIGGSKAFKNLIHNELFIRFYLTKNKVMLRFSSSSSRRLLDLFEQKKYDQVISYSEKLDQSQLNPRDLKVISKSHLNLNNFLEHNRLNQQILELRSNLTTTDIISQLVVSKTSHISHRYSSQRYGGYGNLGIITHLVDNVPKYITKIKDMSNQRSDLHIEEFFYRKLLLMYPNLTKYTPSFLDYIEFNQGRVSAITIEYIDGRHATLDDFDLLFDFQMSLMDIKIDPLLDDSFKEINLSRKYVYSSRNYWQFILWKIKHKLNEHAPHTFDTDLVWLTRLLQTKKLHKRMANNELFALQHHDFWSENIIINSNTKIAVAIDWGSIGISLYGNDLVHFLITQESPLKEIYSRVIQPLCMKKPNLKTELGTALILDALHKKITLNVEILDFIEDFKQAMVYLKTPKGN